MSDAGRDAVSSFCCTERNVRPSIAAPSSSQKSVRSGKAGTKTCFRVIPGQPVSVAGAAEDHDGAAHLANVGRRMVLVPPARRRARERGIVEGREGAVAIAEQHVHLGRNPELVRFHDGGRDGFVRRGEHVRLESSEVRPCRAVEGEQPGAIHEDRPVLENEPARNVVREGRPRQPGPVGSVPPPDFGAKDGKKR